MPRLPRISGSEAVRVLERLGFIRSRQTGSHVVLKKPTLEGEIVCVVPLRRELKVGTLSGVREASRSYPGRVYREFMSTLKLSILRPPTQVLYGNSTEVGLAMWGRPQPSFSRKIWKNSGRCKRMNRAQ